MIDSQRGAKRRVGYNHLISNKHEWNNCFIKNHQQILLDFADFAWLEQPEGTLMDAISRVWYNGSYTIAAKPIKTLELHYTMIQFLIIYCILCERMISAEKMLQSDPICFETNQSALSSDLNCTFCSLKAINKIH